jgi:hypothetical protein
MFGATQVGTLSKTFEDKFGLANWLDKRVIVGCDLPAKISTVLPQETLQSMVSGERVSAPVKGQKAVDEQWRRPAIFASNAPPDYADAEGQVGRRVVPFFFNRPVQDRDPLLSERMVTEELPAAVARALTAYLAAVEAHAGEDFWKWCPPAVKRARAEMAGRTNTVRSFLALDADAMEAEMHDRNGNLVRTYPVRVPGLDTAWSRVKAAYEDFTREHCSDRKVDALETGLRNEGFSIESDNVCLACYRHAPGATKCCAAYSSRHRRYLKTVRGLDIVRITEGLLVDGLVD